MLIAIAALLMTLFGRKVVHAELVIPAPPAAVWSVLTDARKYQAWNPVIIRVEGEFRQDAELINHVRDGNGDEVVMRSRVLKLVEDRELNQFGGTRGILTFDHKWILEPVDGGTRVIQHEEYRGLGVWFWDASWVEPAYQRALKALKDRVVLLGRKGR